MDTPVSKHVHSENHSHKHMKFSVIQWSGTEINPQTKNKCRAIEMDFIWDVPTINPIGINEFV